MVTLSDDATHDDAGTPSRPRHTHNREDPATVTCTAPGARPPTGTPRDLAPRRRGAPSHERPGSTSDRRWRSGRGHLGQLPPSQLPCLLPGDRGQRRARRVLPRPRPRARRRGPVGHRGEPGHALLAGRLRPDRAGDHHQARYPWPVSVNARTERGPVPQAEHHQPGPVHDHARTSGHPLHRRELPDFRRPQRPCRRETGPAAPGQHRRRAGIGRRVRDPRLGLGVLPTRRRGIQDALLHDGRLVECVRRHGRGRSGEVLRRQRIRVDRSPGTVRGTHPSRRPAPQRRYDAPHAHRAGRSGRRVLVGDRVRP